MLTQMFSNHSHRFLAVALVAGAATATAPSTVLASPNDDAPPPSPNAPIQVKRAVVVFRHGDRTPISPPAGHVVPLSATKQEAEYWLSKLPTRETCLHWLNLHPISAPTQERIDVGARPWGQLTQIGAYQARSLGEFLRERLINQHKLLPTTLKTSDIRAHSTSIYRSQQTLQNVLLGLYAKGDRIPPSNTKGDRITIHVTSTPSTSEFQYSPDRNKCRHLSKLHHVLTHSSNVDPKLTVEEKEVLLKMRRLFRYPKKLATTNVRSTLVCLRSHGRELPPGILDSDLRALESINSTMEHIKYSNANYFKLALGRLVPRIVHGLIHEDVDGTESPKLTLFSGHDSTIKPLTTVLGVDDMSNWPPYCASLLFEYGTSDIDGSGHIRVLYNEEVKQVIGCESDENGWMEVSNFLAYFNKYGITDQEHGVFCDGSNFGASGRL